MLEIIILGAGAGGGFPQWNSAAKACQMARQKHGAKARSQTSLALSADGKNWFLINASPDLRQQILATNALHHQGPTPRGTPIQGVLLSNAEIDSITGLLTLREREAFSIMGSPSTLKHLDANPIFEALTRDIVPRIALTLGKKIPLLLKNNQESGLFLEAFPVPGKAPLYAEGQNAQEDDTLGFEISSAHKKILFIAGCAQITPSLIARAQTADLLFFDGTLWHDKEMIDAHLSPKTGKRMGHVSISEEDGPLKCFAPCQKPKKIFIHINNSNPILLEESPQRKLVEQQGWIVGEDGMTFYLSS